MPRIYNKKKGKETPQHSISDAQIPMSEINPNNGGIDHVSASHPNYSEAQESKPQTISIVNIPKLDVTEGKQANRIAKTSNVISMVAVSISALLFIGTLVLVIQSRRQTDAAIKSSNAAISADSLSKVYNDSSLKIQKDANRSAVIASKKKDALDSQTFEIQIKSLADQETEYNQTHQSFLQVGAFDTVKWVAGAYPEIGYFIGNIGSQPAKTIKYIAKVSIDTPNIKDYRTAVSKMPFKSGDMDTLVLYVVMGAPQWEITSLNHEINQWQVDQVKTGRYNIYIRGEIFYINLTNGQKMKLEYGAELALFKAKRWRMIYNENFKIK